jgi:hypothetical protein
MAILILVLLLLGLSVALSAHTMRDGSRVRRQRLKDREELPMDDIHAGYFASRGLPPELVYELWCEVADGLGVPPGILRPSDRFDLELAPVEQWDDDLLQVQWAGERRLKRSGIKADLSEIRTLGDYVEFFCNLPRQKEEA